VKRARVVVSGRVQGVFFRASCAEEARRRDLAGWVRNRPDRRVEAAFEGRDADVDAMVAWCSEGPAQARVDAIEVAAEPLTGENGFHVTA
jgi:acylphosphatase